eukprot:3662819-Alexandrium_andersonii.AAC.1
MSASLVGSEMCIRDSLGPRLGACHGSPRRRPGLRLAPGGPTRPPPFRTCLLYTSDAADDM